MARGIGRLILIVWALAGCDDAGVDVGDAGAVDSAPLDAATGAMGDAVADVAVDAMPDAQPDAMTDAFPGRPPDRGVDPEPARRMNHIQVRGTHNSYHIANPSTIDEWDYTHRPLSEQLGAQGVRQFELDVHWRPELEGFAVYHLPVVDDLTVCHLFVDCLREIDDWLNDNPDEGPVFVLVEPKDDVDPHFVRDHYDTLEAEIRASVAPWRLLTPDDVRGEHPDLRTAVLSDGWPSLHAARGRAMFVLLDSGESRTAYVEPDPTLAGRAIFPAGGPDRPWSGVMLRDGAVEGAEGTRAFVAEGYLVRTRADDLQTFAVALDSGAHMVSTDYPDVLRFADDAPERCNPVSADACEAP